MWCLNFERTLCARNTLRLCEMPSEASNAFQHEKRSHTFTQNTFTQFSKLKTQPRGSWRGRRTNPLQHNRPFLRKHTKILPKPPQTSPNPKHPNPQNVFNVYATHPPTRYRVRFLLVSCSFARDFGPQNLRSRTNPPGTPNMFSD